MNYQLKSPPSVAEMVDGEYIIINMNSGYYYNIVGHGAKIFEYLTQGGSLPALIDSQSGNQEFARVLENFISHAVKEELLTSASPDASPVVDVPTFDISEGIDSISISVFTDMKDLLGLDPIHEVDATQGWPHQPV